MASAASLIFLDIDGCLNEHTQMSNGYCGIRPRNVQHLNTILRATDAGLVISSAWRYLIHETSMTLLGFRNMLMTHGVDCRDRVEGHTCRDEEVAGRGLQIRHWLNDHGDGRAYVVIDDGGETPDGDFDDFGIEEFHAGRVVWTRPRKGLTRANAHKAIEILTGKLCESIHK